MADTDENSTDPTDPRHQLPAPLKPVAPAPRVNPPNANAAKETPAAGGPPGFGDFLEWMRSQGGGDTAASTEAQRALIPKEKKKFQRHDTDLKADRVEPPEGPAKPSPLTPEKPLPVVETAVPVRGLPRIDPEAVHMPKGVVGNLAKSSTPRVRRGQQAVAKRNSWVSLLIQIGGLALLVGSFWLGRASVSKTIPAVVTAPAAPETVNKEGKATTNLLSDANAALIDQAMTAEQSSDFKKARDLLEQVKASGEHVYGLTFQRAQLAVFANDNLRAVPLLNEALGEGEELSSAYNLRATLAARASTLRGSGLNEYETATKVNPFEARPFFYWGAALRAGGKFQAALVRLNQALDRLREPTAEGLYRLDIRLTQIELGQEKDFADELNKQMALPNPGIDWLFTAAALAVRDGKSAEAAAYLARAEQCGDPDAFSLRLRDYFFAQHSFDKELKPFFDKLRPAKPGIAPAPPAPSPSAADAVPPAVGLVVPEMPPPASPGATVSR